MKKKKSVVALAKEETIEESVAKVFRLLGGVENLIDEGDSVVLKPNAGHSATPESSVDTNPEVLRAVIREVRKAKPASIVIAEAGAIGCDTIEAYKTCGIWDMAQEEGVPCIDIKREEDLLTIPVRGYKSNIKRLKYPRFLLEADHIINVPILKAHASMVFSGALKNIKGVVQDSVHMQMHQQNLTLAMMDVWYAARADINIMDIWNPAGGFGPHTPVPLHVGCIGGSLDPVAMDRVACEIVGLDADKVDYFRAAEEAEYGTAQLDEIEVVGNTIEECYTRMWIPYIGGLERWPEYNICKEGACSSCQALLALNMEKLKSLDAYDSNTDKVIVMGSKNKELIPDGTPDEKIYLHGRCTKPLLKQYPNAIFIQGCPPAEDCLSQSIIEGRCLDASPEKVPHMRKQMAIYEPKWKRYVQEEAEKFYKRAEDGNA